MNLPVFRDLKQKNLILGSKSPRRKELLQQLGLTFTVRTKEVDEVWPQETPVGQIAEYLSTLKAKAFEGELTANEIVLCADTTVVVEGEVLNKPENFEHAQNMLQKLSGKTHQVISGICMKSHEKHVSQSCVTEVNMRDISREEIDYYINTFKPYDKAGSYGIQEWIGAVAITSIKGSYNNVVGLPTHLVKPMLIELC